MNLLDCVIAYENVFMNLAATARLLYNTYSHRKTIIQLCLWFESTVYCSRLDQLTFCNKI